MNTQPIAVFDSGIGGLATLSAIRDAMPTEDLIYFGDTAFMPFGTKTETELKERAVKIAGVLDAKGAKMIIIACNTMSSLAIPSIYEAFPMMLVQGMVEPVVRTMTKNCTEGEKIGFIATPRTIESGAIKAAMEKQRMAPKIFDVAIPELVVFIENGIVDGPQMEALLHSYMDKMVYEDGITSLILGCTHFPMVSDCIKSIYPELKLLDPAEELGKFSDQMLSIHELDNPDGEGSLRIFTSKKTPGFCNMAESLGFGDMEITEENI